MKFGRFYSNDLNSVVKQVNKTTAKKMYESGKTVYMQSCNMRFDNVWQHPADVSNDMQQYDGYTFEQICDNYTCYNCDNVRGKYPCFFVLDK